MYAIGIRSNACHDLNFVGSNPTPFGCDWIELNTTNFVSSNKFFQLFRSTLAKRYCWLIFFLIQVQSLLFLTLNLVSYKKYGHIFCCHHQRLQRQRSHCQYLVPVLQQWQLHLETQGVLFGQVVDCTECVVRLYHGKSRIMIIFGSLLITNYQSQVKFIKFPCTQSVPYFLNITGVK